jgi:hypothetical protein
MDSGWGLPGLKGPTGARTPSDGAVTPKDILDFEARLKSRGKDSVQVLSPAHSCVWVCCLNVPSGTPERLQAGMFAKG